MSFASEGSKREGLIIYDRDKKVTSVLDCPGQGRRDWLTNSFRMVTTTCASEREAISFPMLLLIVGGKLSSHKERSGQKELQLAILAMTVTSSLTTRGDKGKKGCRMLLLTEKAQVMCIFCE